MIHDGYRFTISQGLSAARGYSGFVRGGPLSGSSMDSLRERMESADRIVVGAGAGLSTAAGFTYSGKRFTEYFRDFIARFGIADMYSGGFYDFPTRGMFWGWWSRHIYYNRYIDAPVPVYRDLLKALEGKDYFVVTTNVDHQFQRAGIDRSRLFYTQGDYGLFQRADGRLDRTYDNEDAVYRMLEAQGFARDGEGVYRMPADPVMEVPDELIPRDSDGNEMVLNLRSDDSFLEDPGWRAASDRYYDFLKGCRNADTLYLEIGVGYNTPVIIKYPFWQMAYDNPKATYACVNYDEAVCPEEILDRSVLIKGDAAEVVRGLV